MSVFGNIVSAIFGSKHAAGVTTAAGPSSTAPSPTGKASTAGASSPSAAAPPPAGVSPSAAAPTAARSISRADVEEILKKLADEQRERLEWKTSIVDLMKLLKLDSSLAARKQLAQELGYKGKLDGSAEMNVWLHEQVMVKLAEGGGKVPESLKRA